MSRSIGLLESRKSFRSRVVACIAVDLVFKAALAPAAVASTFAGSGAERSPSARDAAPAAGASSGQAAAATAARPAPGESVARPEDTLPELWAPRAAVVVATSPARGAESLFDGDPTTGFTAGAGESAAVRLELGSAQEVIGLGVRGNGHAKIAIFAEDAAGARTPIGTGRDAATKLQVDHWAQLAPDRPAKTSALVVQWTASTAAPAAVTELALWVAGRSRQALTEAAIVDRLVTELPENATAATAVPWTASVARVTRDGGSVSAKFDLKLSGDPLLGRAFLVYEVEKKAHWTGVARSINGHVVRGGYRAEAQGLGGVQVEEINPAWLRRGDNVVLFQPTLREDGRGYTIHNVRIVSVPRGSDPAPAPGARTSLSDGDLATGVGGPGAHTASLSVRADREPAFLSFYLDKPTGGTLTVAGDGGWSNRKGQVNVELDGRPAGWQTVPVAGVLPTTTGELKVRVRGDKESAGQVGEVRVHWFPALASQAGIIMSYPLHGECHDHKTYVRGFAAGPGGLQKPLLSIDGAPVLEKIDADGSFEADVQEPADAKGKPWSIRLDVATGDGGHRTRTVPVDSCVETPKSRIIGVSPPVEDVGAPYGAVVSPQKASTLSFAGATLDIPAGAVDSDVRVTMRALDRGQVSPVQSEMDNVTTGGGALRFGPHGLKFKKPIKVTLPIDASRMPAGMNEADVVAFFFDEASGKWTELPKVLGRRDRVVAETTHFTDFIASTIKMPDHPDGQKFDPNTMKGVKAGEPGAGITLIQPPEANSQGSARLSYPIETPPGRNGIGPKLALTYDSDHANTNGWLGLGWDLRTSSIEIDTRFGVPKYDGTDIYTLDGAMLTPTATSGTYIRRVEGPFDLIKRAGTGPTTYSWTVTDKTGTVYTYGTVANSRLANPRSGQTGFGNIFRWYLEKVQDTYGNNMTITYQHDASVLGTSPNTESGDAVYPSAIDYTANANTSLAANYHVTFSLDAVGTRPDNTITARSGFVVATRQRLTDVVVKSGTTIVRQYHFDYQQNLTDTMQKSVLADVALWGPTGQSSELYRHTFEYAKAPAATAMFSRQQTWGQVSKAAPSGGGYVPRTDNGLNHSSDNLIGGAVSLGVGFPDFSATGSFGMDYGTSTPDLAFLGITGEGLPDQIDINGFMSQSALTGVLVGQHLAPTQLSQLTGLGATDRSGWTAGGSISALGAFGASASYGRHLSNDRSVITDINGDGFPDVVWANGGEVDAYLNNGQRGFTTPAQPWVNYDLSDAPFSTATRVSQAGVSQAFFKTDPLTRWVAPFTGTVTVNSTAVKLSSTGDALRVELYIVNDAVRSVTIPGNDPGNLYTLASNVSHTVNAGDKIFVRLVALNGGVSDGAQLQTSIVYTPPAGRSASDADPTGAGIFSYGSSDGVALGQPNVPWHLTGDGDIGVARCFYKSPSPDDVKVSYVIRDKNGNVVPHTPTLSWTFAAAASSDWSSDFPSPLCVGTSVLPPAGSDTSMSIISGVKADQNISLEVTSDAPVNPSAIGLYPMNSGYTMTYTRYCRLGFCGAPQNTGSGYTIAGDPYANFTIPAKDITYGLLGATITRPYYQATVQRIYNSGTTATTNPTRFLAAPSTSLTFGGSVRTSTALTEDVYALIQGVNKLHAKVRIPKGTPAGRTFSLSAPSCTVTSDCEAGRTCSGGLCTGPATVTAGEPIFFTIQSPTVIGGNVTWSPTVNGAAVSSLIINDAIQDATYDNNAPVANTTHDPMSGGFHHWFYGDWNDNIAFVDTSGHPGGAIVRTNLRPRDADAVMGMIPMEFAQVLPWIDNVPTYFFFQYWQGRGGAQIGNGTSPSNVVPGRVNNTAATATSGSGMSALRVADTWNVDVSLSATPVIVGGNGGDGTTQVDFFDVNGDRFPDSITRDGVQYNDGVGSFSPRQPANNMMFSDSSELRSILNAGLQAGVTVGGGSNRQLENEADGDGATKKISATVSLAGSADYGVSSTRVDFVDVNGDGLLDHVEENPSDGRLRVKLNLGYGFSNEVAWTAPGWGQDHTVVGWPSLPGASGVDPVGAAMNKLIPGSPNNTNVVRLQDTGTVSASVGLSVGDVVGGGGGPTWSVTRKWVDLIDVNGDGLPDQVMKIPGDTTLHVKLNQGDRFSADQNWTLPSWAPPGGFDSNFAFMSQDTLEFSTINGWGKNVNVQVCVILCFGMSGYESDSQGGASATFEDVDGDGKVDQVMKVPGDANVYAKLSNIGPTNLLTAVNRPLGGRFTIGYTRVGNYVDLSSTPKVNMPANQWAMDIVVLDSGNNQNWNAETFEQFDYTNATAHYSGYFDPVERENLGYANVKTIFENEDTGGTSIASSYQNQNYYLRGLQTSKTWYQDNTNQIIQRVVTDQFWDQSGKDATQQLARTGSYFPSDGETDTYFYEMSGAGGVHTFVSRLFDTSGNLTDYYDNGDASNPFDSSDKFNYHIAYAHPATNITVPSGITIRQGVGTSQTALLLAKRTVGSFDPGGKPKTVTDVIVGGKDPYTGTVRTEAAPGNATWTFTYDAYGNVKTATSPPPGGTSTNRNLQYTYDTTVQTYPTTTAETDTDAPYSSTASYDLRFGLPLNITDVAGAQQQFCYDNYGRTTKVFAPSDLPTGFVSCTGTTTPTIAVGYSEAPHTGGTSFAETVPAWAMATHLSNVPGEGSAPGATYTAQSLHTVNFVDGLERSIQTKKDITHDDGAGTKALGMSVGGPTTFDARGRVYQKGQPIFVPGTTGDTSFVAVAMNNPTQYAYDVLGRLRQEQHPDSGTQATTTISYQLGFSPFDGREYVLKMTADPLYGQDPYYHYRAEYRTVHDYVALIAEPNIVNNTYVNLSTVYVYDPLGRLLDVMDPYEDETFPEWDTVGNLVAVTSPDAGRHEWRYCLGGYVCAEQSANMIAVGPNSLIKNTYSRDRLATTTYPNSSTNSTVTYTYGAATQKGNATTRVGYKANRVTQRTDEAGTFTYDYDGLGDVVTETATLKNQVAGGNYQAYTTNYTWDSFGRLIDVTIPGTTSVGTPAETIRYGYDAGGAVASALGKVGSNTPSPYVQHVGYDEFGSRVFIKYGNQATSSYGYYPDTRRLASTSLTAGQPATLTQSQSYNYDLVGNLKSRQQELPLDPVATDVVPVGGVSYQYFNYDPLNQLTHTDMYDRLKITQDDAASVDLYYDMIGNIVEKDQTDGGIMYDSSGNYLGSYSGLLTYSVFPNYRGTTYNISPHAASSVDKSSFSGSSTANLTYDHDGNLTSSVTSGSGKFITWTDTDRVRYVCNGTSTSCAPANAPHVTAALYAADGTRTHNKVTQGTSTTETVYVNQYLTVRNGTLPTKHVYVGDARVASKVDSSATVNNTYWYHSDNVQSTQYVTTANGALAQHLRYYPGGEIWREQNSSAMLTPVAHATTFSAKELDASGYYYFGARYYDPTVQAWLSPDPILSQYIKKGASGALPKNLDLYTYSWNNPVVVQDPDGRKAVSIGPAPPASSRPPSPSPNFANEGSNGHSGGGAGGAGGGGGGAPRAPQPGVGVPPGERFAGGTCSSCTKPPLERGDPYKDYAQNHPFTGWLGGLIRDFVGSSTDEKLDHAAEVLTNLHDLGEVGDRAELIGHIIENREGIMNDIVVPAWRAPGRANDAAAHALSGAVQKVQDFVKAPSSDTLVLPSLGN